jgi:hypothetical protein
MRLYAGLVLTCSWLLACASGPPTAGDPETYGRRDDGRVWVRGPWEQIRPSKDVDEVIDQLCPVVMQLPRAQRGEYGQEYCGAIYSLGDGTYYASHPSPLSPQVVGSPEKKKMCRPPRFVNDSRGRPSILADYHSHPWPGSEKPDGRSFMSREDLLEDNQLWLIRIQFDTACHVLKYIPYMGEQRPGEVYERMDGRWKLVGIVKPENKPYGKMTSPK